MATLLRFIDPERGARLGVQIANTIYDVTEKYASVSGWLHISVGRTQAAIDEIDVYARNTKLAYLASVIDAPPIAKLAALTSPIDAQEIWGTLPAKADAAPDERPPLFFKAQARNVIPSYGKVGIRKDSKDSIPVPALALLLNPALEIVGYGTGLDMTARDILSANPNYLPQAKVYTASCALGLGFVLNTLKTLPNATLSMTISREKEQVYTGEIELAKIGYEPEAVVSHLGRANSFSEGAVLLIGTAIAPSADFSLRAGDSIRVSLDGAGTLSTSVIVI
jgi:2-dehydro-3-deoxy-D-arabinonate dehydratase